MNTCTKCNLEKPEDQFTAWPRNKWCRTCSSEYQRNLRRQGYRPSGRNKRIQSLPERERQIYDVLSVRRTDIVARKRRYNVPGTVPTIDQLVKLWNDQRGLCALTGRPLALEANDPDVVSVDQIDPREGYDLGNIQLVGWAVNRAKGDLPLADFLTMCVAVVRCNDHPERE